MTSPRWQHTCLEAQNTRNFVFALVTSLHASACYDEKGPHTHFIRSTLSRSPQAFPVPILLFAAGLRTLMNPMSPAFSLKHCRHMFKSYLRIRPWPLPVVLERGKEGTMMSAALIYMLLLLLLLARVFLLDRDGGKAVRRAYPKVRPASSYCPPRSQSIATLAIRPSLPRPSSAAASSRDPRPIHARTRLPISSHASLAAWLSIVGRAHACTGPLLGCPPQQVRALLLTPAAVPSFLSESTAVTCCCGLWPSLGHYHTTYTPHAPPSYSSLLSHPPPFLSFFLFLPPLYVPHTRHKRPPLPYFLGWAF